MYFKTKSVKICLKATSIYLKTNRELPFFLISIKLPANYYLAKIEYCYVSNVLN